MIKKGLKSGLIMQMPLLLLLIVAIIILSRTSGNTNGATSTMAKQEESAYVQKINKSSRLALNDAGNSGLVYNSSFALSDQQFLSPTEGYGGGPILVISSAANPFSRYTVEILRAEGLNEFNAKDISAVNAFMLDEYDVVILGEMNLTTAQVSMFSRWINSGGTFIAFKPCRLLTPLLGITPAYGTIADKYLLVNTSSGPGAGIVDQTIQFHGEANLHSLKEAKAIAMLYAASSSSTDHPAVTMMSVGTNGGSAFAFMYDLPRSIVYTRQGNPAWAGQKRDGQIDPIRPDDLFYPDWLDFDKVAIPQADEQQRLLANIILQGSLHRKPLPRFWYFPGDFKAVIVMTGDNHTNNGTTGRFYQYLTLGPNTAQDLADWKSVRATSYIYPNMPITDEQAIFFQAQGFEIALHTNTGCLDYTSASLKKDFTEELGRFALGYPDVFTPVTNRSHCLNWSDWSSTPKVELQHGIRLDATYYYWPEAWTHNRPGMFTGSGIPMRFADLDGSIIDVYQMPTQMTDETNMDYSFFCNSILDKAIGKEGYYGVFCANMHTDHKFSTGSDAIIASAKARQVPVISARQMLTWLDGRNNSFFSDMKWQNNQLSFSITLQQGAYHLKTMLPLYSEKGELSSLTQNDNPVPFNVQTIKGMQYAFFAPMAGTSTYVATYTANRTKGNDQRPGLAKADKESSSEAMFYVNAAPNPAISYFNLVMSSDDMTPVSVHVSDISGRMIETHEQVPSTGILRLGQGWRAGTYFSEITQGRNRKVVKMVKVN
ncbi:MAG: T9SS type A sorting domain-containing protein [Chitinophagales bacterium]